MSLANNRVGFMQGRLSPIAGGRIQAFPWDYWQQEFPAAENLALGFMEWTLDHEKLHRNPLLTVQGQHEIRTLCRLHQIAIQSLTGDCFMQAPFWKANGKCRVLLETDFISIARACSEVGIEMIVVPLVDNGRLEKEEQEKVLLGFMQTQEDLFRKLGLRILFESDFLPEELACFIGRLPADVFGINYDIGNSAALGLKPSEEFSAYGSRILNVHVKDRMLGGTTVPLGEGNASFDEVFKALSRTGYNGNFILQTARASDGNHVEALRTYRDRTKYFIKKYFNSYAA